MLALALGSEPARLSVKLRGPGVGGVGDPGCIVSGSGRKARNKLTPGVSLRTEPHRGLGSITPPWSQPWSNWGPLAPGAQVADFAGLDAQPLLPHFAGDRHAGTHSPADQDSRLLLHLCPSAWADPLIHVVRP